MAGPSSSQILTEAIVFWTIGLFLFVGRLWSRAILKQSWKKFQADDYLMVATFSCYTTLLVLLQFSSRYATNELLAAELPAVLADPQQVQNRIFGSKIVVGTNQCYLLTLWGVKACVLTLYYQITLNSSRNNLYVKIVAVYIAVGLLAIEIPYFFILCRPFSQYWAMPVHNQQCANYWTYCIIQVVFNVSSDLLMLAVPIPFIVGARVPKAKKALLVAIFSLGIFVILAAILNKVFNFTHKNTTVYMIWELREASTAVYVANIMCWWPLLRKLFGFSSFLRASLGSRSKGNVITIEGISETEGVRLGDLKSADFVTSAALGEDTKGLDLEQDFRKGQDV
ncbi:hypothetical protein H2200_011168 [Cladophialophora chaetospira]|uniref:Rhodopsin domain-containing protein n=1 Tax=Cladophialophora chaetospira TaxID=386627 RepID=A0AA38X044_9EURO|nr:hypothetical protein H2200_011168 [Cladophialophora chaetospira]